MLSLVVNLSDGRTLSFPFDEWQSWAALVESSEARGLSLQNGSSSCRFVPPRRFRRVTSKVEAISKDGEIKGIRIDYFADVVIQSITIWRSGVIVSSIEKLGRRIGP